MRPDPKEQRGDAKASQIRRWSTDQARRSRGEDHRKRKEDRRENGGEHRAGRRVSPTTCGLSSAPAAASNDGKGTADYADDADEFTLNLRHPRDPRSRNSPRDEPL